ncbi:MAG: low molecular weight protein-tyrosine-phosphatase, partial [Lachnospiraceae bacterium]
CRSPMAEFVLKDMVKKLGIADQFEIASAATSSEEIGNPVHRGTQKILDGLGIDYSKKRATKLKADDYHQYDYLIGMDSANIRNMQHICGGDSEKKIYKLLDFTMKGGDITDPWYSGRFDETYEDVVEGLKGFLAKRWSI